MKITKVNEFSLEGKDGYHIVTFAETGFAMLNSYGEHFGLDENTIEKFSCEVNERDESRSLHPKAPISAVPRRYIRDMADAAELENQIEDLLAANSTTIHATKVLFDFRAGVAPFVIEACERALCHPHAAVIEEAVIISTN